MALDIGNTSITIGVFNKDKIIKKFRISANKEIFRDLYFVQFKNIVGDKFLNLISKAVVVSVVPKLNKIIKDALELFKIKVVIIKLPDLNITIKVKNPLEVGHDRLVNSIMAYNKFKKDCLIIDFGTATNFDLVSEDGSYLGGIIAPGVNLSINALYNKTSQLPKIKLNNSQKNVIGKSTVEAINSGIYFGYISLVEGLIKKIKKEYNNELIIIITGGLINIFKDSIKHDHLEENLTLEGINLINSNSNL